MNIILDLILLEFMSGRTFHENCCILYAALQMRHVFDIQHLLERRFKNIEFRKFHRRHSGLEYCTIVKP